MDGRHWCAWSAMPVLFLNLVAIILAGDAALHTNAGRRMHRPRDAAGASGLRASGNHRRTPSSSTAHHHHGDLRRGGSLRLPRPSAPSPTSASFPSASQRNGGGCARSSQPGMSRPGHSRAASSLAPLAPARGRPRHDRHIEDRGGRGSSGRVMAASGNRRGGSRWQ
ncbi:hypothetical protein C2845_PM15G02620 [Panicum miliaceum]|uniref:Uncharacterized protein n=1 Tax=Panicum miliaceum TaxID=4540 RepID=A0A3L6QDM6_PANMI|nr:hypothetical protein C2845_PM15G02620 [Panicum miliaceum]